MEGPVSRKFTPFAVLAISLLILSIAIARLPDSLVAQMRRSALLTGSEAGWAYRLLLLAAVVQAIYGAAVLLQPERVQQARRNDDKIARMDRPAVVALIERNAAAMIALTFVYGLAAFLMTGQRGGFWVFWVLCLAQGAWYYRQVGEVSRWLSRQPETRTAEAQDGGPPRIPPAPPPARELNAPGDKHAG